jgi:hypothetical protein
MRSIVILILLMLQLCAVMATAETSGVPEKDTKNDLAIIAPNDFNATLNYSYEEIDRHALNAPASAESSVDSLAAYLIEPAGNDREKARAIFRWITENIDYNVEVFFKGGTGPTNSEDVLKSRKSVCYGYSDIFLSLAREAGLETIRISGYGKGYGYAPGKNFSGLPNHAWNAVKINGSWYLMDSTWGAGYVSVDKKYVRKFDDHFFMTPPSQFIYDHFPEDAQCQVLHLAIFSSEINQISHSNWLEDCYEDARCEIGERVLGGIADDKTGNACASENGCDQAMQLLYLRDDEHQADYVDGGRNQPAHHELHGLVHLDLHFARHGGKIIHQHAI